MPLILNKKNYLQAAIVRAENSINLDQFLSITALSS